jgi:hypothetical protein
LPPILTQAPAGIVLLGGKLEMAVIYLHTRGEPLHELAWMGRPDALPGMKSDQDLHTRLQAWSQQHAPNEIRRIGRQGYHAFSPQP